MRAGSDAGRGRRRPLIGYAFDVANPVLGIRWVGAPHEIVEELRHHGLTFSEVIEHEATTIRTAATAKDGPEVTFSGGPLAEDMFDFLIAIEREELAGAESIVERNREILSRDGRAAGTLLLAAIESARADFARLFVRHGLGLDHEDQLGMTALHWAAALGEAEIAGDLLAAGAEGSRWNWFYLSPGELAVLNGHKTTERMIAERGGQTGEVSRQQVMARMRSKSD